MGIRDENTLLCGGFEILFFNKDKEEKKCFFSIQSQKANGDNEEKIDVNMPDIIAESFSIPIKDYIINLYKPPTKNKEVIENACVKIEFDIEGKSKLQLNKISISEKNTYHIKTDYFDEKEKIKFTLGHHGENTNPTFLPNIIGHPNEKTLAPGHHLGSSKLTISSDKKDKESISFKFDVRPVKINWKDAEAIFDQVYKRHYELLFEEPNKSSTNVKQTLGSDLTKTKYQRLLLLEEIIETNKQFSFANLIYQIAKNPHKQLISEKKLVPVYEASNPDFDLLPELFEQPLAWNKEGKPIQIYDSPSHIDYNTPPNRFVKYVAFYFSQELLQLKKAFEHDDLDEEGVSSLNRNDWVEKSKKLRNMILPMLNSPFFQNVDNLKSVNIGNNQVLLKEPRYRKIAENYIKYIRKLEFSEKMDEWFANPLKWMPELYEYWCLFELDDILREICKKNSSNLKYITGEKLGDNNIIAEYNNNGVNIEMYYNLSAYENIHYDSYSVGLRPDLSIQISKGKKTYNLIFDAKYRVNIQDEFNKIPEQSGKIGDDDKKKDYEKQINKRDQEEKRGKFISGDIYKMHTYREALRKDEKHPTWVIDLYPGTIFHLWSENNGSVDKVEKYYSKKHNGGVGAIPLKPKREKIKPKREKTDNILKYFISEFL